MVLTGDISRIHDPSRIIRCGDAYYLYCTGHNLPMKYSTDLRHWQTGPAVLDGAPEWARNAVPKAKGRHIWAPDVIFLNEKYYLFYSYSTFGSKVSITGLVTSPTLDPQSPDYYWTDEGVVLATTDQSGYNAIDPAPILDERGDLWLGIGSWFDGGILLVQLDKNTGKPVDEPQIIAAQQSTGPEAAYLHYHDGYYYLFENEGFCCRGLASTYVIMVGRAKNIRGPYLDRNGRDLATGGGTVFLEASGAEIGPGHVGIWSEDGVDRFTYHYYDSRANGVPTLGMKTLFWDDDGWPRAGKE